MKTILCYGDSNTWGAKPRRFAADVVRIDYKQRWTGVLQDQLGDGFKVIEEGLRGRTTAFDDPVEGEYKNGYRHLLPCLEAHRPLDLVVLFLGTNDLKARFGLSPTDISGGIERLIRLILASKTGPDGRVPEVLLLSPPYVGDLVLFAEEFEGAKEKSFLLGPCFQRVANLFGCHFFDISHILSVSEVDGIHLDELGHQKLGKAIAEISREIFIQV